jgi:hypothetical protein
MYPLTVRNFRSTHQILFIRENNFIRLHISTSKRHQAVVLQFTYLLKCKSAIYSYIVHVCNGSIFHYSSFHYL